MTPATPPPSGSCSCDHVPDSKSADATRLIQLLAPLLAGPSRGYIPLRSFSTSHARRDAAREAEKAALADEQKRIYAQFRPVVDAFDAPIDMAVAYGSGVVKQANKTGVSVVAGWG